MTDSSMRGNLLQESRFDPDSTSEANRVSTFTSLNEIDIGNWGDYHTVHPNTEIYDTQVVSIADVPLHPVTLLYQICTCLQWPRPHYELVNEEITASKHVFTMKCKVLKYAASGVGLSKKKAKTAASKSLLTTIKDEDGLESVSSFISSHITAYDKQHERESCSKKINVTKVNATNELYKMCHSSRWPLPVYELLSTDGPEHNTVFRVGCKVPGITNLVEGKGLTKREAKNEASLALLDKLTESASASPSSSASKNSVNDQENNLERVDIGTSKNATSLLHELCTSNNWPHPVYELKPEGSYLNRKLFTVGCSLLGHSEIGSGYTKKEAKHEASLALLTKLGKCFKDSCPVFIINTQTEENSRPNTFYHFEATKDYVSTLHEMCTSKNWPYPTYKFISEEILQDNQKLFTVGCFVSGYTSIVQGSGCTKKKAKHSASQALLNKIVLNDEEGCETNSKQPKNYICDCN